MNYYQLQLTCRDSDEANRIAKALLEKKLIACAKQIPVSSAYRWQGKIERASEVLLLMESREDLFEKIENEVAKLHSYETFVLQSSPISRSNESAFKWLSEEFN